ncbi:CBR-TAG-236 protein [Loa loa]|uniref:CBR-TAG-236 protein n=1 Tax=Loa loa TaxID=7209 RepID=A0A1S0UF43_LOALO|nr:CBR-TAG-236 protein [Loa loa]EJD74292.1 CBR-TAG-236 protein [Loa loa]
MLIIIPLASRSFEKQKQKYQRDEQKKVNEKEEGLEKAEVIALSVPGQLQTVLENLPLVYNTDDKSLQQAVTSVGINDTAEKVSFKPGHRRRSSYESAQIQLTHHPRHPSFHRNIHWMYNKSLTTPGSFLNSTIATTNGAMATTTPAIATAGTALDSAIGGSLSSKQRSLDCHNELSAGIIPDGDDDNVDEDDRDSDDGISFDNMDSVVHDRMRKRSKKGGRSTLSLLSSTFTRKLFSRNKQHEHQHTSSWRLFGTNNWKSSGGGRAASAATGASCSSAADDICCSTTGLILEDRPSTLPAKSIAEQRRHEAQYLALIEATKRQEARRVRQRQQLLEKKRKEEDETAAAAEVWCSRILPNWENIKDSKHCRDLWWRGIPSKVRGHVWSLAIGNELNLTPELYEICVTRARRHAFATTVTGRCGGSSITGFMDVDQQLIPPVFPKVGSGMGRPIGREGTLELIHLDVSRTFPHLGFFQKGGPYEELLLDLLGAYVCYRPDIGYVQSMCFLGAMLLLQIHQPYQSFQAFANLLNRPLMLAFFGLRQSQMTVYFIAYDQYFEQELPKLHHHFDVLHIRPDMYLIEWVYTLYAKSLPFDVCCRVWDVFLRDGEQFIFNTALGIMHLYECELENMNDFDAVVHFLTHLPESMNVNQLFDAIEPFVKSSPSSSAGSDHGNGKKRSFQQIHSDVTERIAQAALMADGSGNFGLFSSPMDALYQKGEPSIRDCGGDSCKSVVANGIVKNSYNVDEQQAAAIRLNLCNMKMSKSLSEFVDDMLRGACTRESDVYADVVPKSRAPTAV